MKSLSFPILLLLPIVLGDVCPWGYTYAGEGGDCFKVKTFYNAFATQYTPKSFDDVEIDCNSDYGGMLTSIHSDEENAFIQSLYCDQMYRNFGLRCKGTDCKWDDGSPMDYKRFLGADPSDDGRNRCYGMNGNVVDQSKWKDRGCGKQEQDCWVCRVKAKTIDCIEGETEYKGGCVSVQTTTLNGKTAEESCPGGGRLVSIHSSTENAFYKNIALNAGVTGTIFIGGQFANGVFQWIDNSYANIQYFATGFPNTIFGTCVQMLLDSEFGSQGQWTNIDCSTKQPFICIRDGSQANPTDAPRPKADARCPSVQYYSGMGSIYSPNYPLSIPGDQNCEYVIGTLEGFKASVKFLTYDCHSGVTLSLFDGLNSNQPFKTFTTDSPVPNHYYHSSSNVMKMVFSANGTSAPVGTGWEAEFTGI